MGTLTNYNKTKAAGLSKVEHFSHDRWTDYNSHDPGVTILEYLCYALSDLAVRTDLDMADLLADAGSPAADTLHKAHEILPNRALTLLDYRKLLIDIDGIKNAWLQPRVGSHRTITIDRLHEQLSVEPADTLTSRFGHADHYHDLRVDGQYDVVVQCHDWVREEAKARLLQQASECLHANRNLCEDFSLPQTVTEEPIGICFNLQLSQSADNDSVIAEAAYQLDRFISPIIRFRSLAEMQRKGLTTDRIFDGPLLKHGFIDDDDLLNSELRSEIHASDLIQILMDIPGVLAVSKLQMTSYARKHDADDPQAQSWQPLIEGERWVLPVTAGKAPAFSLEHSRLVVFKENIPYSGDPEVIRYRFQQSKGRDFQRPLLAHELLLQLPKGSLDHSTMKLADYPSIQNHFPLVYGIGQEGLPGSATQARKNEARQLKAYLLLIEQFMANYLAQLDQVAKLFSPRAVEHTLFTQEITDIREYKALLVEPSQFPGALQNLTEDTEAFELRRNRFLDHMMARLGENFGEYSVLADVLYGADSRRRLIGDKQRLLSAYAKLSPHRAAGFNCLLPDNTHDVAGLTRRLENFFGVGDDLEMPFGFPAEFYRIYEEADEDAIAEWRFEIVNDEGKNLLSSTHHYATPAAAMKALQQALTTGLDRSHYEINQSDDGFFHALRVPSEAHFIARKIKMFATQADAEADIDHTLAFLQAHETLSEIVVIEHNLLRPHRYVDMAGVPRPVGDDRTLDTFDPAEYDYADADLLATCVDPDYADCPDSNPYAFRITVVLPYKVRQFRNMSFRRYLERFIRELTPAHILARICWVDHATLSSVSGDYRHWQQAHAAYRHHHDTSETEHFERYRRLMAAQRTLIQTMATLNSVYPTGHLHDCREGDQENPMILGQSKLGIFEGSDNG